MGTTPCLKKKKKNIYFLCFLQFLSVSKDKRKFWIQKKKKKNKKHFFYRLCLCKTINTTLQFPFIQDILERHL